MKLYVCRGAPSPTRVRLYLAEKTARGASLDVQEVRISLSAGEHRSAAHLARNPAGKVPVLEVAPGSYLTESLAIIEYLEECCPEPAMLGQAPLARARQRELDRMAELRVLHPLARWVHATNSPLGLPADPVLARQAHDALATGLATFERLLECGPPYLGGDNPGIADCTLAAALHFGVGRGFVLPADTPSVVRWWDRCGARPAFGAVLAGT